MLGDLSKGMGLVATKLGDLTNSVNIVTQNQATLNQRMGTLETTVNQQGVLLGNINGNVLSLQQGQSQTNALLQSLVSGNNTQPANSNIMGQMFNGQVGTQLGGMQLNGVAGAFPGATPQASNPLYGEPDVTFVTPGGQSQTTIDANGQMHVVDPFGRIGGQP